MEKFNVVYHFVYELCQDACNDLVAMRKEYPIYSPKISVDYDKDNNKYWRVHMVAHDLTEPQIYLLEEALNSKFRFYEEWIYLGDDPDEALRYSSEY